MTVDGDSKRSGAFVTPSFDEFRRRAEDESLDDYQRIGFSAAIRGDREDAIFDDIADKLANLHVEVPTVVDIGPGCSRLPRRIIDQVVSRGGRIVLVDSQEMLDRLPDGAGVTKLSGRFPAVRDALVEQLPERGADVVLAYSVLQHVVLDDNPFNFLDGALELLAEGGELLLGDIPNVSKRKRFLASSAGEAYHKSYMQTDQPPDVRFNVLEPTKIDDATVLSLVQRARLAGYDAYLLPQPADLPMANRREDLYVRRP